MKVICDRGSLLDAVNLVASVVAQRTPRPQLTCIKLSARKDDAGEGTLVLAATDAEISMRMATRDVEVQAPGEALVPADKLRQIISAEDAEATLALESEGDTTHIRGRDAYFKVYGYPPADFPDIPSPDAAPAFTITADTLDRLISRTVFSTARENSRYAINGVLVRRDGKKLEFVATDGRRLAVARASADDAPDGEASCIIPTKALSTARKLVAQASARVSIAITDSQAIFTFDDGEDADTSTTLASNLVEGSFPPYEDVIPKDQDKRATFEIDALGSAVRRAALLTNEESRGVRLAFSRDDRALKLSSRAPEMGEAEISVEIAEYDGDDIEIGFNPAFITDALKILDNDRVVIEMKAPNKPGLIKSGSDFIYVVMPVNLQ